MRLVSELQLAEDSEHLWLRGPPGEEATAPALAALPALDRYERVGEFRLRRINRRIPSDVLPELAWQPLAEWLQVELPLAALPAKTPQPAALRLVASSLEREADVLLTTLAEWANYVASAPL